MSGFQPERWAVIGVKNETGSGRMTQDLKRLFPELRLLAVPAYRLGGQPLAAGEIQGANEMGDEELTALVKGLQGIILLDPQPWARKVVNWKEDCINWPLIVNVHPKRWQGHL